MLFASVPHEAPPRHEAPPLDQAGPFAHLPDNGGPFARSLYHDGTLVGHNRLDQGGSSHRGARSSSNHDDSLFGSSALVACR